MKLTTSTLPHKNEKDCSIHIEFTSQSGEYELQDIAETLNTSPSSIIRFSKKLLKADFTN